MRIVLFLVAAALVAAHLPAQTVDFEIQAGGPCGASFPSPKGTSGDPEGVSSSGNGLATVDSDNGCGFPAVGMQYLRVDSNNANGGIGESNLPGVPPTTLTAANEVFLAVPPGAGNVSFFWDFYNQEGPMSTFNDGMMVDAIDANCNQLAVLAFADTFSNPGVCVDGTGDPANPPMTPPTTCSPIFGVEVDLAFAGPGAEVVNGAILPAGTAFIRVAVWNSGDDAVGCSGVVDAVTYGAVIPPTYPGTGEDLISTVAINGSTPTPVAGGNDVLSIAAGDFVEVAHNSPGGAFVGIGDFVSVGSAVITPAPLPSPFPGIYLDPTTAFVVIGGTVGGFPYLLPVGGAGFSFVNSGTLAGLSFGVQAFVITSTAANSIFASTNALELQLN